MFMISLITSTKRNFEGYAEAYINKLRNNGVTINPNDENTIRNWTKTVLPNQQKTENDPQKCDYCDFSACTSLGLGNHKRRAHGEKIDQKGKNDKGFSRVAHSWTWSSQHLECTG